MDRIIRIDAPGAPDVLRLVETAPAAPGPGEIRIEQEAVGINYLDVMQRKGSAPLPMPGGVGLEGAGTVTAVGEGVTGLADGDRVAYILGPAGAYASARILPAARAVRLPQGVSCRDAAAMLFKGITADYLIRATGKVKAGDAILLYGAAGGVAGALVPMARKVGARVIGVVSRPEAVPAAEALGCEAVLVWGACDLPAEVKRLTGGRGADIVVDGVGRDSFSASLACLAPRGLMALIGASTGQPEPFAPGSLAPMGSLFLTRPTIIHHATDEAEYRDRAAMVLGALESGLIAARIQREFPLEQAAAAHAFIEAGGVTGAVLLRP